MPPIRAFAKQNIFLCQFPFPVPDEHVEVYRAWLAEYDEVWVYSDFVRRYVSGSPTTTSSIPHPFG